MTGNVETIAVKKEVKTFSKKNQLLKYVIQNKWLYILLILGYTYLFIFRYLPMFGMVIAFKNFDITKGIFSSEWVGLDNFKLLFSSGDFWVIFKNSILLSGYHILWGFPAPIILAIMLNEVKNTHYKRISQTILYLPHFISWVVIAGMFTNFLSPNDGLVNYIVKLFGGKGGISFLAMPEYFRTIIVSSAIWKEAGWGSIIYLAAISSLDSEIYEASVIDGANRLQQICYITIPGIMSTVIVMFILKMGHLLDNGFEQIFMFYNPLTYSVGDVFETYTYRVGLQLGQFGYASAVGLFKSLVGFLLIIGANKLANKVGEKGIW